MIEPAINPLALVVSQVTQAAELETPAMELRKENHAPREYLNALIESELLTDALKFLAHLLPRREAVWWAWLCAQKSMSAAGPGEREALAATEKWISEPSEAHRRAAFDAANAASLESAAGCAALAAFLSSGSLGPPDVDEIAPPRYAAAKAVFGSLVFAAVTVEPQKAPEKFRKFLDYGLELAERIDLWKSLDRAARATPVEAV